MRLGATAFMLGAAWALAAPAAAQQVSGGSRAPTVITPGPATPGAAPAQAPAAGAGQFGPGQVAPGDTGGASAAQGPVGTTVFPPVENIVPGSQGAVVFPPAESITGVGAPGQTVLPPAEQTVPGAPGGFPFTDPNVPGGVQQNFQQGVVGTGLPGSAALGTAGTGQQTAVNPFANVLNQNQLFPVPGGQVPGQTGTLLQPPATQDVFFGGANANQGFSVGPLTGGGGVAGATLPAVPQGLGPGSRPGDAAWIGAEVEPYDADEPDALDFSRSP